jgi:hypothetical protein
VNVSLKNCSSQIRCNIEFSFRFSQNLLTAITSVSFLSLRVVTHNGSNECSGEVGWVVKVSVTNLARQWPRVSVSLRAAHVLLVFCSLPAFLLAQTPSSDSPIPILSGSARYFNFVAAGQNQLDAQINPVLLLPLGDRWLVESRAEFDGAFHTSRSRWDDFLRPLASSTSACIPSGSAACSRIL